MTGRRLLAHLLAAIAYGALVQGCLGILLLTQYHGHVDEDGHWTTSIDVLGTEWSPAAMIDTLILLCICAPVLVGFALAVFRPIPALESKPALIAHAITLAAAILMHLFVFFFAILAGWNSTSF